MDKRISIFIFSCFLLTWIASALGSDPDHPGTVAPTSSAPGEYGAEKPTSSDPPESGAEKPTTEPSISGASGSTKSPTNNTLSSGESGSTKSPTNAPGTSLSTAGSSPSPTSAKDSAESGSSSSDKLESTTIASSPASKISTESQTYTSTTQELGTASPTKNTTLSKVSSTMSPQTVPKIPVTARKNHTGSGENLQEEERSKETSDKKFLWILLPAVCCLLAAITYWKFKCKKVQHRPEMIDNGTENASFQRTDSNKDGVMLLGVSKTPSGAENVV